MLHRYAVYTTVCTPAKVFDALCACFRLQAALLQCGNKARKQVYDALLTTTIGVCLSRRSVLK